MAFTTDLKQSTLLPQIANANRFLQQEVSREREEYEKKRVNQIATKIIDKFNSLPEDASEEQVNAMTRHAMAYAYQNNALDALKAVEPMMMLARDSIQRRKEKADNTAASEYLGIPRLSSLESTLNTAQARKSLSKDVEFVDDEGYTVGGSMGPDGKIYNTLKISPFTVQETMEMSEMSKAKANIAEQTAKFQLKMLELQNQVKAQSVAGGYITQRGLEDPIYTRTARDPNAPVGEMGNMVDSKELKRLLEIRDKAAKNYSGSVKEVLDIIATEDDDILEKMQELKKKTGKYTPESILQYAINEKILDDAIQDGVLPKDRYEKMMNAYQSYQTTEEILLTAQGLLTPELKKIEAQNESFNRMMQEMFAD